MVTNKFNEYCSPDNFLRLNFTLDITNVTFVSYNIPCYDCFYISPLQHSMSVPKVSMTVLCTPTVLIGNMVSLAPALMDTGTFTVTSSQEDIASQVSAQSPDIWCLPLGDYFNYKVKQVEL